MIRVPGLSLEDRWPDFSRGAVELGARSMLSFQLFVEGDRLGALNLYGKGPNAFNEESEQVGLLVAAHAAVAFADSQKISELGQALVARQLIGQAEGILMERYKFTAEQAFLLLTRASSRSNIKLRDVAEHLASSGEITTRRLHIRVPRIRDLPSNDFPNHAALARCRPSARLVCHPEYR